MLHQARVGWRRFRSACRLFKPVLAPDALPSWEPLHTLLTLVGALRDMDVAGTETLPQWAQAYAAGDASREARWQAMTLALTQAAQVQRKAVGYALEKPAVGAALLGITQWLEALPQVAAQGDAPRAHEVPLRRWARQRIARLHRQLKGAMQAGDTPENQHRIRILAKRLRYGIEALKPLLSRRRAARWHEQASGLQTGIGLARDMVQAGSLMASLGVDRELAEFLRGVAAGQSRPG